MRKTKLYVSFLICFSCCLLFLECNFNDYERKQEKRKLSITMIGDSRNEPKIGTSPETAKGSNLGEYSTIEVIQEKLEKKNFEITIHNCSAGGASVLDFQEDSTEWKHSNLTFLNTKLLNLVLGTKADVYIIDLGTNDLGSHSENGDCSGYNGYQIELAFEKLIKNLKKNGENVIILKSPSPVTQYSAINSLYEKDCYGFKSKYGEVSKTFWRSKENLNDLRLRLENIAKKTNIIYVDGYSEFIKKTGFDGSQQYESEYMFDGIHENQKGINVNAEILYSVIYNNLK